MAIASVQNFLETVSKHGISRTPQYRVLGFGGVPEYVQREFNDISSGGDGGIVYLKSGAIPGRSLTPIEVQYLGFKIALPGQAEYSPNPMVLTFRTPEDYLFRNALEQWSFEVFNELTNNGSYSFPCPDSIMDLAVMGSHRRIMRIYRLFNLWPEAVSEIQYNLADAPNEVDFTASFRYSRWSVIPVTDSGLVEDELDEEQAAIFEQYRAIIEANKAKCSQVSP